MDVEGLACSIPSDQIIALDEALERFCQEDPEKAQLVKLRFFAGLSIEEAAEALGISRAMASRHWTYARTRLYHTVSAEQFHAVDEARTGKSRTSDRRDRGECFGCTATRGRVERHVGNPAPQPGPPTKEDRGIAIAERLLAERCCGVGW